MEYMTVQQTAEKWDVTIRRVQKLCVDGRIEGAVRFGNRVWMIPDDAEKPADTRYKRNKA